MFPFRLLLVVAIPAALAAQTATYGFGRAASREEIQAADITVSPDGAGLPHGHGNAVRGEAVFKSRCEVCHGPGGVGRKGEYPALVGGRGSLGTSKPVKTVGSFWPYATTVWDHINRAMPFNMPHVLPPDDVYAVTAYVLYLNKIVGRNDELNKTSLPKVEMPNRNGFVPDSRPDIKAKR